MKTNIAIDLEKNTVIVSNGRAGGKSETREWKTGGVMPPVCSIHPKDQFPMGQNHLPMWPHLAKTVDCCPCRLFV